MFGLGRILKALRNAWRSVCTSSNQLRREWIVEHYLRAGARFGDALSVLYMGECIEFDDIRERFAHLEALYAELGYRTISLDDFIEYGGYGRSVDHLLRIKRDAGEDPVYHALHVERLFTEGFAPISDFGDSKLPSCCRLQPKDSDSDGHHNCAHHPQNCGAHKAKAGKEGNSGKPSDKC